MAVRSRCIGVIHFQKESDFNNAVGELIESGFLTYSLTNDDEVHWWDKYEDELFSFFSLNRHVLEFGGESMEFIKNIIDGILEDHSIDNEQTHIKLISYDFLSLHTYSQELNQLQPIQDKKFEEIIGIPYDKIDFENDDENSVYNYHHCCEKAKAWLCGN